METINTPTRRKLLLGLGGTALGASQLPQTWSKPIIDSVILPVHAQTTSPSSFKWR